MRGKRKTRYTWLPTLGEDVASGGDQGHTNSLSTNRIFLNANFDSTQERVLGADGDVRPLVADLSYESTDRAEALTLRDRVEGQDWLLKRIVGSIFVAGTEGQTSASDRADIWQAVIVTVGFLVARAGDSSPGNIDLSADESDPQGVNNTWNPWVWRRSWLIGMPGVANTLGSPGYFGGIITNTNMAYGDMRSGPHIDSKVSRRIQKEHRLWMSTTVRGFDPNAVTLSGAVNPQPTVTVVTDLRILGAMRKARNSSSF